MTSLWFQKLNIAKLIAKPFSQHIISLLNTNTGNSLILIFSNTELSRIKSITRNGTSYLRIQVMFNKNVT